MQKVRAKFFCEAKFPGDPEPGGQVTLRAVYTGSPENEQFFQLTPAAYISMSTLNESAFGQFEAGKEYYVDFIPVEVAQEEEKGSDY